MKAIGNVVERSVIMGEKMKEQLLEELTEFFNTRLMIPSWLQPLEESLPERPSF